MPSCVFRVGSPTLPGKRAGAVADVIAALITANGTWWFDASGKTALDPAVIVTLGRHSLRRYLPEARISAVHGQLRRSGGRYIFPMYHPAAALHQSSLRETLFADIRGLPAALLAAREAIEAERVASLPPPFPEPAPSASAAEVDEAEQMTLF